MAFGDGMDTNLQLNKDDEQQYPDLTQDQLDAFNAGYGPVSDSGAADAGYDSDNSQKWAGDSDYYNDKNAFDSKVTHNADTYEDSGSVYDGTYAGTEDTSSSEPADTRTLYQKTQDTMKEFGLGTEYKDRQKRFQSSTNNNNYYEKYGNKTFIPTNVISDNTNFKPMKVFTPSDTANDIVTGDNSDGVRLHKYSFDEIRNKLQGNSIPADNLQTDSKGFKLSPIGSAFENGLQNFKTSNDENINNFSSTLTDDNPNVIKGDQSKENKIHMLFDNKTVTDANESPDLKTDKTYFYKDGKSYYLTSNDSNNADTVLNKSIADMQDKQLTEPEMNLIYMNDDEKKMYNYILGSRGISDSDTYLNSLQPTLGARKQQELYNTISKDTEEHPVLSTVNYMLQGANVKANADAVAGSIKGAISGDTYDPTYNDATAASKAYIDTFTKDMSSTKKSVVSSLLGAGRMATGLACAAFTGGSGIISTSTAMGLMFSLESASEAQAQMGEKTGSSKKAALSGLATGVLTYAFSKVPIMNLLDKAPASVKGEIANAVIQGTEGEISKAAEQTTIKSIVGNMATQFLKATGKSAVINTSYGFVNQAANFATDFIIAGDKSDIRQAYNAYKSAGLSNNDAMNRTFDYVLKSSAEAGIQSAIDMGLIGMAGDVINIAGERIDLHNKFVERGKDVSNNGGLQSIIDKVKTLPEDDSARIFFERKNEANDINEWKDADIGKLAYLTDVSMSRQNTPLQLDKLRANLQSDGNIIQLPSGEKQTDTNGRTIKAGLSINEVSDDEHKKNEQYLEVKDALSEDAKPDVLKNILMKAGYDESTADKVSREEYLRRHPEEAVKGTEVIESAESKNNGVQEKPNIDINADSTDEAVSAQKGSLERSTVLTDKERQTMNDDLSSFLYKVKHHKDISEEVNSLVNKYRAADLYDALLESERSHKNWTPEKSSFCIALSKKYNQLADKYEMLEERTPEAKQADMEEAKKCRDIAKHIVYDIYTKNVRNAAQIMRESSFLLKESPEGQFVILSRAINNIMSENADKKISKRSQVKTESGERKSWNEALKEAKEADAKYAEENNLSDSTQHQEELYKLNNLPYLSAQDKLDAQESIDFLNKTNTANDLIGAILEESKDRHTRHGFIIKHELNVLSRQEEVNGENSKGKFESGYYIRDGQTDYGVKMLKDVYFNQILGEFADRVPVSITEKFKTFRVMSMLLNAKTAIRNIAGNIGMHLLDTAANNNAWFMDRTFGRVIEGMKGNDFTKAVSFDWGIFTPNNITSKLARARESYLSIALDVKGDRGNKYTLDKSRTFKRGPLASLERAMGYELSVSDVLSKTGSWQAVKRGLIKCGWNEAEAEKAAKDTALYRTFNDDGAIAIGLDKVKEALNKAGIGDFGLGDVVMPFTHTNGNIVSRTLEYSPLGYIKAIVDYHKATHGADAERFSTLSQQTRRDLALNMSRATTGVGLMLLGGFLYNHNIIVRSDTSFLQNDNSNDKYNTKDVTTFEKARGKRPGTLQLNISALERIIKGDYNTNIQNGDELVSVTNFPMFGNNLSLGVSIAQSEDKPETLESVAEIAGTYLAQEFSDVPSMQTARTIFNAIRYGDSAGDMISQWIIGVGVDFASSVIPQPVKQLGYALDETARNPYNEQSQWTKGYNRFKSLLPFGTKDQVPVQYDTEGNPVTYSTGNKYLDYANSFFLPESISTYKTDDMNNEIARLGKQNSNIFPDTAQKYFEYNDQTGGKTKLNMYGNDYSNYQKRLGEITMEYYNNIMQSDFYKKASDRDKIDLLLNAKERAKFAVQNEISGADTLKRVYSDKGDAELAKLEGDNPNAYKKVRNEQLVTVDNVKVSLTPEMKDIYAKVLGENMKYVINGLLDGSLNTKDLFPGKYVQVTVNDLSDADVKAIVASYDKTIAKSYSQDDKQKYEQYKENFLSGKSKRNIYLDFGDNGVYDNMPDSVRKKILSKVVGPLKSGQDIEDYGGGLVQDMTIAQLHDDLLQSSPVVADKDGNKLYDSRFDASGRAEDMGLPEAMSITTKYADSDNPVMRNGGDYSMEMMPSFDNKSNPVNLRQTIDAYRGRAPFTVVNTATDEGKQAVAQADANRKPSPEKYDALVTNAKGVPIGQTSKKKSYKKSYSKKSYKKYYKKSYSKKSYSKSYSKRTFSTKSGTAKTVGKIGSDADAVDTLLTSLEKKSASYADKGTGTNQAFKGTRNITTPTTRNITKASRTFIGKK